MQALCAALAATIGTGNIAGVAGAIALGGPGAIFWMWVCALFGMITKFAEATLAVHYRQKIDGEWYSIPELPLPEGVERGWTMEGYTLRAGKMTERTEKWSGLYGSLPKGQYRLIKWLDVYYSESVYDNHRIPLYNLIDEHYTVAIEFEIK